MKNLKLSSKLVTGSRHFLKAPVDEGDPFVRGHAFEVDMEVGTFAPGLHMLGEIAFGDADPQADRDFFGAQGWLAWRSEPISSTVSAIEPIFRASYGDPGDESVSEATLLTPGINVHFGGRNRFMVNYDFVLLGEVVATFGTSAEWLRLTLFRPVGIGMLIGL